MFNPCSPQVLCTYTWPMIFNATKLYDMIAKNHISLLKMCGIRTQTSLEFELLKKHNQLSAVIYQLLRGKDWKYRNLHWTLVNLKCIIELLHGDGKAMLIGLVLFSFWFCWTMSFLMCLLLVLLLKFKNFFSLCYINRRMYKFNGGGRCYENSTAPPCTG